MLIQNNLIESIPADELLNQFTSKFSTILADPPWQFQNRTGKMAPEHKRLLRYPTMTLMEIKNLPIALLAANPSHLYLWCPNAMLESGLEVMRSWGFEYKSNIIWHKVRKDGGSDGRGVGFYFRNVTEILLFGVRGKGKGRRTLAPARSQVNYLATQKREHSRKPDEIFDIIESCSPGPYLELFARFPRVGWTAWGNENVEENESNGVALRRGHIAPHLRLVEPPRNYRGVGKPTDLESFEDAAIRRTG
ncbi:MAG: MT-A70 family methyltransferase [Blastocatellia bacterium]